MKSRNKELEAEDPWLREKTAMKIEKQVFSLIQKGVDPEQILYDLGEIEYNIWEYIDNGEK